MTTLEQQTSSAIRPFHVDVPAEALDDLRRRLTATRWPSRELVVGPVAGRPAGDDAGAVPLLGGASTTGGGARRGSMRCPSS